jgi:hypothetical protein
MAESFYKTLDGATDIVDTRTLLHEAIPLTGTIVSGTYSDANIKNFSHGMFQSVYDYPYLSSSANHIFDITIGVSTESAMYSTSNTQYAKKRNIYNQMAQLLMGYDHTGSILRFDADGNIAGGGNKLDDVFFLNFSRLLVKDEIKKGSFELILGVKDEFDGEGAVHQHRMKIQDTSGSDGYLVNSPAGEYGILFATGSTTTDNVMELGTPQPVGLLFYQAGVAVISGSVFNDAADGGILNNSSPIESTQMGLSMGNSGFKHVTGSAISASADAIRTRIYNIQFNNTTELNSTIYFCRMNHNEFNYSTNPTYLSGSKIRVKTKSSDSPVSYITTIGLYSDNNELMAVAKLSEPLRKDPSQEFTIRARLDY